MVDAAPTVTLPVQNIVSGPDPINQIPDLGPSPGKVAAGVPQDPKLAAAQQGFADAQKQITPFPGGTPDGSIRSTDAQATADQLNALDAEKGQATEKGKVLSQEDADLAAKQTEAANEKIQQAADFKTLQDTNLADYNAAHNQTQAAYDEYRKVAGSLKDPNSQFWEDKGQGSRITAALAAFSSGLGSGVIGHVGNPFVDFLTKQIDNNFNAHKQNIEDKYNSAVAAGKIQDSVENHNRFMNEAKLKSFDLSSAHIASELAAIQNSSASKVAKITAANAVTDLEKQGIAMRQTLAQHEAAKSAAALAAQRAQQKEVRETFQKNLELHNKDMGAEDARAAAIQDLVSAGYNRSQIAAIAGANGGTYNTKTDKYEFPKTEGEKSPSVQQPTYDDQGQLIIPTKTAQGKLIPQEEQDKTTKDALERTANVDGKPEIFRTKEYAEAASAIPEARRLQGVMQKAFDDGDKGTYDQARLEYIEMAPKLLGYKRGPSGAQAGESGKADEADKATIAGQLPEFNPSLLGTYSQTVAKINNAIPIGANTPVAIAKNKLAAVKTTIDSIEDDAKQNLVTPTKIDPKAVKNTAAKLGLKKAE